MSYRVDLDDGLLVEMASVAFQADRSKKLPAARPWVFLDRPSCPSPTRDVPEMTVTTSSIRVEVRRKSVALSGNLTRIANSPFFDGSPINDWRVSPPAETSRRRCPAPKPAPASQSWSSVSVRRLTLS